MNADGQPAMNQRIFEMGFSTEVISLYLLCCGIQDSAMSISTTRIAERWNGSSQALDNALKVLKNRNIVVEIEEGPDHPKQYKLTDVHAWR
jgi:hypothetical protein